MADPERRRTRPPLSGTRIVEFGGIGPGPFGTMILADMGADVLRIDRPGFSAMAPDNVLLRGRRRLEADLKSPVDRDKVLGLCDNADVVIEGFRPGVMERLGLGPEECLERNPGLVYARMTGWGQYGPYASVAGHDINYLAIAGVLDTIGRSGEAPVVPLNYVADYGGGGMFLVAGVLAALVDRSVSGLGQVVDVAMVDGSALFLSDVLSRYHQGRWIPERGSNPYDSGAPYYDVYRTLDGKYMAVGAIEAQFYRALLAGLGLMDIDPSLQEERSAWAETRRRVSDAFASRTQAEWSSVFAEVEACVTPVVPFTRLAEEPHLAERRSYQAVDGTVQPGVAPRFSRSQGRAGGPVVETDLDEAYAGWTGSGPADRGLDTPEA